MHKLTQAMMDKAMKNPKTQLGVGFGGEPESKKKPMVKAKTPALNKAIMKLKK